MCKKKSTLKKHFTTKHEQQNCKVCNITFKNSLEVLKHVAKDHRKNITENISVKEKELIEADMENEERNAEKEKYRHVKEQVNFDSSKKFECNSCFECKEIVSLEDKFNDDLKEDQMCKLCTMFEAYGEK